MGLASILGAMTLGFSAFAAGTDSRTHTCAELHGLITAKGFIFINNSYFQDFVVANSSYCGGGYSTRLQQRSVPTSDSAECPVNYCGAGSDGMSGGGGM
jgi:hypothetical protein